MIRRHRVTYRDDSPVSASTSWLPGDLAASAPRLLTAEHIVQGTTGYIEQETGRAVVRGLDQESARAATEQDAEDLGVPPGSPVACGRNWWYGRDGEVIEYGERVSIPGRWSSHRYEIAVNGGGSVELLHSGKIRDVYADGDDLILVASDRISVYDVVLPTPVPEKGKILTALSLGGSPA